MEPITRLVHTETFKCYFENTNQVKLAEIYDLKNIRRIVFKTVTSYTATGAQQNQLCFLRSSLVDNEICAQIYTQTIPSNQQITFDYPSGKRIGTIASFDIEQVTLASTATFTNLYVLITVEFWS